VIVPAISVLCILAVVGSVMYMRRSGMEAEYAAMDEDMDHVRSVGARPFYGSV
jgi:hypothetical protein